MISVDNTKEDVVDGPERPIEQQQTCNTTELQETRVANTYYAPNVIPEKELDQLEGVYIQFKSTKVFDMFDHIDNKRLENGRIQHTPIKQENEEKLEEVDHPAAAAEAESKKEEGAVKKVESLGQAPLAVPEVAGDSSAVPNIGKEEGVDPLMQYLQSCHRVVPKYKKTEMMIKRHGTAARLNTMASICDPYLYGSKRHQKSALYAWIVLIIAVFYLLPASQLMLALQVVQTYIKGNKIF